MITAIATRSILLKQEETEGGNKKDIKTKKGEKITLTEREAIQNWGALKLSDKDQKSLLAIAKNQGIKRRI